MPEINSKSISSIPDKKVLYKSTVFVGLIAIAVFAPLLKQQMITGPLVNSTLFIAAVLLGGESAILVGLLPSLIALSVGLLPAPLAPMIPFIMTANAILILAFLQSKKRNYWLGIVSASILKFIFLFATSSIVVNLITKQQVAAKAAAMMSWPQLITALAGGIIAYLFLKAAKKI